jgi:hypothetical protein
MTNALETRLPSENIGVVTLSGAGYALPTPLSFSSNPSDLLPRFAVGYVSGVLNDCR